MNKQDIEEMVGETMEDLGMEDYIDEIECPDCGELMEEIEGLLFCLNCKREFKS